MQTEAELRAYLLEHIAGLRDLRNDEDFEHTAFLLREWVSSIANYPERPLLLFHWDRPVLKLLEQLQAFEGGVWCGGAAFLFAKLLRVLHMPAAVFMYGYGEMSHETTLWGRKEGQEIKFYILDAYLNFHYVWPDGRLIAVNDLLRLVKEKRYSEFRRVDVRIERPLVTAERDAAYYHWLFDGEPPTGPVAERGNRRVWAGATHSVEKVLLPGSAFRELADRERGDQPLDKFMLDLMLVNPTINRISDCAACYPDWYLLHDIILSLGEHK